MQRQSLGSPSSKLHTNGVILIKDDAHISSSSTIELLSPKPFPNRENDDDRDEDKLQKKKLQKPTPPPPEKFIHLIPILTLFCILILYLSSHNPSQSELAGFKHLSEPIDSTNIEKIPRVVEIGKGEILAIGSMRNLQEADKEVSKRYRLNRKIGDF
ncbi:hypothetical protein M9H77_25123 [Catharanthus roseus]|uniref:Uncharacterized protein n=1 Tax=Catharanthus roseus TaxID=4058 RepID=A0ACC0A7V1_CATRO|nr:hypothetical protein M9H77_25123 [Catharanthus roseus]